MDYSRSENEGRRQPDEIPLSGLAIEIIELVRPANVKPDMYVFTTTACSRPISGFSKAKVALDQVINAGRETPLPGFVFHDLRRTMRTALSGLPIPDNVAELVIAHARPGLHKVYDQHSYRTRSAVRSSFGRPSSCRLSSPSEKPTSFP